MGTSSRPFPERERAELADLLDSLGPDAPTCCAGWTTAHMAAHLVVRDRRPDALPGYGLEEVGLGGPAAAWAHRLEERLRRSTGYPEVVSRFRAGPQAWSLLAWPVVAQKLNVAEFAIHHEDVRRAQPGWEPRLLPRKVQDGLWSIAQIFARRPAASRSDGLILRRSDVPGMQKHIGSGGTTVEGEPMELLLWAAGREGVARVEVS
jgi:uncharacterized protein (TIGR03085 family)